MQKLTKKDIKIYLTKAREVLQGEIVEIKKIGGRSDMSLVLRKWNNWYYLHLFWERPQPRGVQQIFVANAREITLQHCWADTINICIFFKDRTGNKSAFYRLQELGL